MPHIDTLPAGALDIIGDIHGEYAALQQLLGHLGYRSDGSHPQGRRLVFVGDLVDRGNDVPAVLDWFMRAHAAGYAQMVLGNHEINLLLGDAKPGSGWYFVQRADKDAADFAPWQHYPEAGKATLHRFLAAQPLVLERDDLRIVHAAWLPAAIARLRAAPDDGLVANHRRWENALAEEAGQQPWYPAWQAEEACDGDLHDPGHAPAYRPATAARDSYYSRGNPVRALTCGSESPAAAPHYAGGRWRFVVRTPWWQDYRDAPAVVIGHYWRRWRGEHPLFPCPPQHWFGARHNVFCCDYAVGARWCDRKAGIAPQHSAYRLAALRWPEKTLVFDDGETVATL